MPISLVELEQDQATCQVTYRGHTADAVVYRPNAITANLAKQVADRARQEGELVALAETLAEILVTWDVMDGDGAMLEPTVANLSRLPSAFLSATFAAIQQHMTAGGDERKNSGAGSRRRAS